MRALAAVLFSSLVVAPLAAESPAIEVLTADAARADVLAAVGPMRPGDVVALAPDGTGAAVAREVDERRGKTEIRFFDRSAATTAVTLAGRTRGLLFAPDGTRVYALQHRTAKRGAGEAYLVRIDTAGGKPGPRVAVPATTQGVALWPERGALLLACRDELRTLLLPRMRSGPSFRVPGPNMAVASLGGSRILVARSEALALINVARPSGREPMPVLERIATPAPVTGLVAASDGRSALARLADGTLWRVHFRPLRWAREPGQDRLLATRTTPLARTTPELESPPAVPARPAAVPSGEEPQMDVISEPEPPPVRILESVPVRALTGSIDGPAASAVVAVVVYGPDDVLREAARARPDADGRWHVESLPPGRYRIQVDGGPRRVLQTVPAFVVIEIEAGVAARAAEIRVLRVL